MAANYNAEVQRNDKEKSSTEEEVKKEENDKLLFLWQRASFMDSGREIPREVTDSLRLRLALLSSYHSKLRAAGQSCLGTGLLLKKDLRRYGNVMDSRDEVKGMNNLCGAVEALLGEKAKVSECRNWESSLDVNIVRGLPAYKKFNEDLQSTSQPINECHYTATTSKADNQNSSDSTSSNSISTKSHATPSAHPNHLVSSQRSNLTPIEEGGVAGGKMGRGRSNKAFLYPTGMSSTSSSRDHGHSNLQAFSVIGGRGQQEETFGGPSQRGDMCWGRGQQIVQRDDISKRSRFEKEEDDDDDDAVQVFSTAREEHFRQQQKRFRRGGGGGGGVYNSVEYGSSKKSLGTRRGASSKFVPPVRKDKDNEGLNEVHSRVFRGGRGERQTERRGGDSSISLPPELENNENLRNIEPRMVELILNEIVDHSVPVQWEDIAGLEFAKATINEVIVWPMMRPREFEVRRYA